MKFINYKITVLLIFLVQICSQAQTILISPAGDGGFETGNTFAANGWTVVNSLPLQTNQWFLGTTVAGFSGTRCAFVGTAATNNNYNANAASVVHIYRDIAIPAGQSAIKLKFRWKSRGRANEDIMNIYLTPVSYIPAAGITPPVANMIGGDYRNNTSWVDDSLDLDCSISGTTQRIVFTWVNDGASGNNPAIALDNIEFSCSGISNCNAALGTGVFPVASLPYNSGPGSTCGMNDDISDVNTPVCGNPDYLGDEDVVWVFTPATTGQISIDLNSPAGVSTGLHLYDGCPLNACAGSTAACVAFVQDPGGNKSMCVGVLAGHTYYLVLDGDNQCNSYDNLFISAVATSLAGSTCANAVTIASLPSSFLNESTACMNDDYTLTTPGGCGSLYVSGEDKVYKYSSAGNECIGITLSNVSTPLMGFQVYYGCPGSGGSCIAFYGGASVISGSATLSLPGTYYIIIDSWAPPSSVGYDLFIQSFGTGASNDLPCQAPLLSTGVYTLGNNSCSSGSGEPAAPLCWSAGVMNTVWFKGVVGAAGTAYIQTQTLTLTDTQVEVFKGTCSGLISMTGNCNDNGVVGCTGSTLSSSLTLTALTPGDTLYIRVDGAGDLTGTFNIIFSDAPLTAGYNQQDCLGAINVCSPLISQPTSFFGCGLVGEIPPPGSISNPGINVNSGNSGCLLASELNIVWYIINIASNGVLKWTHTHPVGFYDWIMFDLTNNSCEDIQNNILPPVRCNWNGSASTMCGMQNPVPPGASIFNFEAPLNVTAGQKFALALSNYSGTNGGFTLDFSGSTCAFGNSASIAWTGATNTTWTNTTNWNGCNIPACGVDANIFPAGNDPVITANTTVNSLTILAGATLTIAPGVTVNICGDFNNYGNLIAAPTSTITMNNGAVTQTFNGNFTGSSKLGNVTISKNFGTAIANNDLDIGGNFLNSGAASIFDCNNKYIRLAGHFNNSSGNLTFINTGPVGTLEFNGTALQTYAPGPGAPLNLNNVVINNSGGGVQLFLQDMLISSVGNLDLQNGKLITNANKVIVQNSDPLSITGGSSVSYVQGTLQRFLNGAADIYEFPIGHAVKGYQLAEVEFTTPTLIPDLTATFNTYTLLPNGPVSNDCSGINYNSSPVLDNGYWSIQPSSNSNSGTFDLRLYPTNFSASGSYTTVLSSAVNPPVTASWGLSGNCAPISNVSVTERLNMNGFGYFGIGQGTPGSLPVELVSFNGRAFSDNNMLEWECLTEKNNDFFILEKSPDGKEFLPIATLKGAGTSHEPTFYSFRDYEIGSPVTYYRLRQVDFNGTATLSDWISVKRDGSRSFTILSNPASQYLTVEFPDKMNLERVIIFDFTGKSILEFPVNEELFIKKLDVSQIAEGCYLLCIYEMGNSVPLVEKFVKKTGL
ncbi:MAG: hypothetical protein U0Y08_02145 [Bacteroidia bacterium]